MPRTGIKVLALLSTSYLISHSLGCNDLVQHSTLRSSLQYLVFNVATAILYLYKFTLSLSLSSNSRHDSFKALYKIKRGQKWGGGGQSNNLLRPPYNCTIINTTITIIYQNFSICSAPSGVFLTNIIVIIILSRHISCSCSTS